MVSFSQSQRKNNIQVLPLVCTMSSDAIYAYFAAHYLYSSESRLVLMHVPYMQHNESALSFLY